MLDRPGKQERRYVSGTHPETVEPTLVRSVFTPLGIPLIVEAGPEDSAAVANALRGWEAEQDASARTLRFRITRESGEAFSGEVEIRVSGTTLRLQGGGADGFADAAAGQAWCRLADRQSRDAERLRHEVLEPLLLFLLTRSGRTPVHAAAFLFGDVAILLAGVSGSGKSCLALAADAAGFPLLTDDMVFVQTDPELRIWTVLHAVHVFAQDAPTGRCGALRQRGAKRKVAITTREPEAAVTVRRAVLCIVAPGTEASLKPIEPEEALSLLDRPEQGFDLLWADVRTAHIALTRLGAWRLGLSADPAAAIRLLGENKSHLLACAAP